MSYKYKRPSYSFESNNDLANEVLAKAGPNNIYYRPGYSTEYSNRTTYTTEISHEPTTYSNVQYKINDDPDPVRIVRQTEPVTQRQNIRIRYLDPPTPPTPAPIVIRERQLTPPPPAPPIYIRQQARAPPTPPPLFIRERPPTPPRMPDPTFIEKIIPAPSPPPRQVIIERIPAPEKPREVIYEKWLPYKPLADRQVIVERGRIYEKQPAPRNVIIDYESPRVQIDRRIYDEGIIKVNEPQRYTSARPNGELRIVDRISDLPMPNATSYSTTVYEPTTSYRAASSLTNLAEMSRPRPKTTHGAYSIIRGPVSYIGPWNTTYQSSYNGRSLNRFRN